MINLEEETLFCSTATLRLRLVHELAVMHKKQLHFTWQSFAEERELKWTPTVYILDVIQLPTQEVFASIAVTNQPNSSPG
jgi:hypothetical protein